MNQSWFDRIDNFVTSRPAARLTYIFVFIILYLAYDNRQADNKQDAVLKGWKDIAIYEQEERKKSDSIAADCQKGRNDDREEFNNILDSLNVSVKKLTMKITTP